MNSRSRIRASRDYSGLWAGLNSPLRLRGSTLAGDLELVSGPSTPSALPPNSNAFVAGGFWGIPRFGTLSDAEKAELEEIPTSHIWQALGRPSGQYHDIEHPFPDVETFLSNPSPREKDTYRAIKDVMVALYLQPAAAIPPPARYASGGTSPLVSTVSRSSIATSIGKWRESALPILSRKKSSGLDSSETRPKATRNKKSFRFLTKKPTISKDTSFSSQDSSEPNSSQRSSLSEVMHMSSKGNSFGVSMPDPAFEKAMIVSAVVLEELSLNLTNRDEDDTTVLYMVDKPAEFSARITSLDETVIRDLRSAAMAARNILSTPSSPAPLTESAASEQGRLSNTSQEKTYETILYRQRDSLKMPYGPRQSAQLDLPNAGYYLLWAELMAGWAKNKYEEENLKYETQLAEAKERHSQGIRALSECMKPYPSVEDPDDDIEEAFDQYSVNRAIPTPGFPHFPHNSFSPSGVPRSSIYLLESSEDAKKRRRGMQFNMGLHSSDPSSQAKMESIRHDSVPLSDPNALRHSVDIVEEATAWQAELNAGVEKERIRQMEERERKARKDLAVHDRFWARPLREK